MRADKFLAQHDYYESRAKARAAIDAGLVWADETVIAKPSIPLNIDMVIRAEHPHPWVSRAGIKLAYALEKFSVRADGCICLDVGASTGGFSDVLSSAGASKIYAVDVGRDQLHPRLRLNDRIISMEQTDARKLTTEHFSPLPDLIVCDVSFISCMKALTVPLELVASGSDLITLVKPQFEVGRDGVGKNGIVRDQKLAQQSLARVAQWLEDQGWVIKGQDISPITGGDGNVEYLLYAQKN